MCKPLVAVLSNSWRLQTDPLTEFDAGCSSLTKKAQRKIHESSNEWKMNAVVSFRFLLRFFESVSPEIFGNGTFAFHGIRN